jgi:hypothetical protein
VVIVLQATEVMEIQVTMVNTGIMLEQELGSGVIPLLVMVLLGLMEEVTRHTLRSIGSEILNL